MSRRARSGQEGSVAPLIAMSMMLLGIMVALVVDIALLRLDRRDNQRTADMAAVAGALALRTGTARDACDAAIDYVLLNSPAAGTPSPVNPCATWSSATACPATPLVAAVAAGDFTIEVAWPVPDTSDLMEGRAHISDGLACERIGVSVKRDRPLMFAGIVGLGSSSTTADTVALGSSGDTLGEIASLVVLDQTGCEALYAHGQGRIHVREVANWTDPDTGEVKDLPGIIAVDSDASEACTMDTAAIEAEGLSDIRVGGTAGDPIRSDDNGIVFSFAMRVGSSHPYDPTDVTDGRLSTAPVAGKRITRVHVDARWGDAIGDLTAAVGSSGPPPGFTTYTGPCTISSSVALVGDTWFSCNPLTVTPGRSLTISGGNVVADGPIIVKGDLTFNNGATDPHWLVIRTGNLEKFSQASVWLEQVAVLLNNGAIKLEGGDSGALTWTAPESPGPDFDLEDLAMWSESSATHRLAGQAALTLEGLWFAPNATPFEFAGGNSATTTVYQTKAQFITNRFDVSGNGELVMEPDPTRNIEVPVDGITLIR